MFEAVAKGTYARDPHPHIAAHIRKLIREQAVVPSETYMTLTSGRWNHYAANTSSASKMGQNEVVHVPDIGSQPSSQLSPFESW